MRELADIQEERQVMGSKSTQSLLLPEFPAPSSTLLAPNKSMWMPPTFNVDILEWRGGHTPLLTLCQPLLPAVLPLWPILWLPTPTPGLFPQPSRHMPLRSLPLPEENISRKVYFCMSVNKVSVSCVQLQPGLLHILVCSASRLQRQP